MDEPVVKSLKSTGPIASSFSGGGFKRPLEETLEKSATRGKRKVIGGFIVRKS